MSFKVQNTLKFQPKTSLNIIQNSHHIYFSKTIVVPLSTLVEPALRFVIERFDGIIGNAILCTFICDRVAEGYFDSCSLRYLSGLFLASHITNEQQPIKHHQPADLNSIKVSALSVQLTITIA